MSKHVAACRSTDSIDHPSATHSQALASLTLANLLECYGTAARFDRIDFKEACAKLIIGRTTDPSTWPEATVSRLSSHSVLALVRPPALSLGGRQLSLRAAR